MSELYVGCEANLTSEHVDQMVASIPGARHEDLAPIARKLYSALQPIGSEVPGPTYPEGVTIYNKSIHMPNTDRHLTREDAQRLLDAINAAR